MHEGSAHWEERRLSVGCSNRPEGQPHAPSAVRDKSWRLYLVCVAVACSVDFSGPAFGVEIVAVRSRESLYGRESVARRGIVRSGQVDPWVK
jgi:hypothetical protein